VTRFECGCIFNDSCIANFPENLPVNEFCKSVENWQSHRSSLVYYILGTVYIEKQTYQWPYIRRPIYLRGSGRLYWTSMTVGLTLEDWRRLTISACFIHAVFLPLTPTITSPTSSASHLHDVIVTSHTHTHMSQCHSGSWPKFRARKPGKCPTLS